MIKPLSNTLFVVVAIHGVCALADPLTDRVVAAFKHGDPKLEITVATDDELHLKMATGGEVTVFLDRTRGQWQQPRTDCAGCRRQPQATQTQPSYRDPTFPGRSFCTHWTHGLWEGIAKDGYGTSHLFDPKFWDEVEAAAGGPVAIALPTRDRNLAARLDDPQSIANLRLIAKRIVAGEPTAVTSALVRRDGESWTEVQ